MEVIDGLENHLHLAIPVDPLGVDHPADFSGDLLVGECGINRLDAVAAILDGELELRLAVVVNTV